MHEAEGVDAVEPRRALAPDAPGRARVELDLLLRVQIEERPLLAQLPDARYANGSHKQRLNLKGSVKQRAWACGAVEAAERSRRVSVTAQALTCNL